MKMNEYVVCCIFDKVAGYYSNPACFHNDAMAVRWFDTLDKKGQGSDYELYMIGRYDCITADFKPLDNKAFIKRGDDNE